MAVNSEVPNDLIGLIPKKLNKAVHIVAPSCPLCGSHTVQRRRQRDGIPFWGCSQYPRCKGFVSYEDHLESVDPSRPKSVTDFLKPDHTSAKPAPSKDKTMSMTPVLQAEVERVVVLAAKALGGTSQAKKWLASPKVALKGKTPMELMGSVEGCHLVEKLLLSIHE